MRSLMLRPKFGSLSRSFGDVFDDFFRFPAYGADWDNGWFPNVNIKDSKDNVSLIFELPGMEKDDIKVKVQDKVLTVSGERKSEQEGTEGDYYHSEIKTGSFCRSFTLPDIINAEKISADYTNGMLKVKLDKLEEVKPKEIEIKVS